MSRTLRRLAAASLLVGLFAASAPSAQASVRCFDIRDPKGTVHRICL